MSVIKMGGTRIYVGNVSVSAKEEELREKFSQYGNIASLEIKSKLDFEGNPTSRFAYLNLETEPAKIHKCIEALDGYAFKGATLKVEVARESFLERLKRERENKGSQTDEKAFTDYQVEEEDLSAYKKFDSYNENNYEHKNSNYQFNNQNHYDRSDQNYQFNNQDHYDTSDQNYQYNDGNEYDNNDSFYKSANFVPLSSSRKETNDTQNAFPPLLTANTGRVDTYRKPEEKIISSFKRFDPTSEREGNKNKRVKEGSSYDQKGAAALKKFVQISTDLNFSESQSSFSLLNQFSQNKESDENWRKVASPETKEEAMNKKKELSQTYLPSAPPKQKTRNFFIKADDPDLKVGVDWLLTPPNEISPVEFQNMRSELVTLCKLRNIRARREVDRTRKAKKYNNRKETWKRKKTNKKK